MVLSSTTAVCNYLTSCMKERSMYTDELLKVLNHVESEATKENVGIFFRESMENRVWWVSTRIL